MTVIDYPNVFLAIRNDLLKINSKIKSGLKPAEAINLQLLVEQCINKLDGYEKQRIEATYNIILGNIS
jgi:hypothetical protein